MRPPENPDCTACRHFFVTWETPHTRGCRAYEFRAAEYPAAVVRATTGEPCMQFEARHAPAPASPVKRREQGDLGSA